MQTAFPTFARSDGSIEAKIIDVVGTYADSEALERENTLSVIASALANQKITRKSYYRSKAVEFQYGDVVSYDSVNFGAFYENVDESKRLVKQAYITGSFPTFTILVNAIDSATGHLRKLTTLELASFTSYFEAFQPIGLDINVLSQDPATIFDDDMRIYVKAGADIQAVMDDVKANLIEYEATLREYNAVTLSEIEDVIRKNSSVIAIGWDDPYAQDTLISGTVVNVHPSLGVFEFTSGAFIFGTDLQLENFEILQ